MMTGTAETPRQFDAIAMEIFSNRLLSITETMAIQMMRSSFSSQIKERRDFSVGIFDADGRLLAQGTHIPLHLGSLLGGMDSLLAHYAPGEIEPGDAFICNDPYLAGGTHLPDIAIISPVFSGGVPVAFVANIGHHSDVGGAVPGSISAEAKTIFEEGIRLPVVRIARRGVVCRDMLRVIALNSRLSEERSLDLNVQIEVNRKGAQATADLFERMGMAAFRRAVDDMLAYTSSRLQLRIDALKQGEYDFTTYLDDDGLGGPPVPISVRVVCGGDRLSFDFHGSGAQARGALNVCRSALRATVYYCLKALLDPELPANSGMFDIVRIAAPEGSILNPRFPAACGARSITCQKVAGAIFGAFRDLLPPERVMASSNDILPAISFSGVVPATGQFYVCSEALGGGAGAWGGGDGMDGVHVHVTNSLNLPTEAMENEFPLRVEAYGLAEDTGGAGQWRGGLGIVRQVRVLVDRTSFSLRSDSHLRGAEGVDGGTEGGCARLVLNPGQRNEQVLGSKISGIELNAGDVVQYATPGGGGYGAPAARDRATLRRDLRDGLISSAVAEKYYGPIAVDRAE
jgi:N-methylhydantoinase B